MDEIRRSWNGWVDNVEGEEYQISDAGIVWKELTWLIRLW
jgi:hypothetical protein